MDWKKVWIGVRKRARNYGLWVSAFALLFMLLSDLGYGIDAGRWDMYVDLFMGILVAAGVVSDPKAGKWFTTPSEDADKDMEKEE